MTVALASRPLISVSRTGSDSQNWRPLSLLSTFIRFMTSLRSTMRLVLHRRFELIPDMPFIVTWMRFLSQGASMNMSSSLGSESRMSKIPSPTVYLYTVSQSPSTTLPMSMQLLP